MSKFARLRAEIDIRESPSHNAPIIERYDTDTLVEILDDQGDFLLINAKEIAHTTEGYVPRLALIFPPEEGQPSSVFPYLSLDEGTRKIPAVPKNIKLQEFLSWFGSEDKPPWIPFGDWNQLDKFLKRHTIRTIKASIVNNPNNWQNWLDSINASNRQNEAIMDEWVVVSSGGREMFPSRHYFFQEAPMMDGKNIGWILKGQVVRWNGQINIDQQNGRPFYEVDFYRMKRATHGWLRGDILAEYIYPSEHNNPKVPGNKDNIFDLSQPILRHPQDPEFLEARQAGRTGAQYLDIRRVIGRNLIHFNLCGEICISTMMDSDVIPVLRQWLNSGYGRAGRILNDRHEGTHLVDLKSILGMFDREGIEYNSTPVSAQFIKGNLSQGAFAISGCCITRNGKVKREAKIRHWVILEDVEPVGSSGWVRIYNPFQNQEEVYEYDTFLSSTFAGTGMWIQPEE